MNFFLSLRYDALGILLAAGTFFLFDKRIVGALGAWECHSPVVSASGHTMEPLLESDVGNDERCSRKEVALRRNEAQQALGTLINGTTRHAAQHSARGNTTRVCSRARSCKEEAHAGSSASLVPVIPRRSFCLTHLEQYEQDEHCGVFSQAERQWLQSDVVLVTWFRADRLLVYMPPSSTFLRFHDFSHPLPVNFTAEVSLSSATGHGSFQERF